MKRPARVLVVDDEPGMVRAVERVLGGLHDVLGSHLSPEALALARQFEPDLVILDVRMPEIDGFELMARLKTEHPGVDIIVMTGSLDDLDQKLIRAIRGRAFYFIQKPFDREVLLTLVERCLELRWRRLEGRQQSGSSGSWRKRAPSSRGSCRFPTWSSTGSLCHAATHRAQSSAAISAITCRSARDGSRCSSPTSWATVCRPRC